MYIFHLLLSNIFLYQFGVDWMSCVYFCPERRNAGKSFAHSSENFQDLSPGWVKLLAAFRLSGQNSAKAKETIMKVNTYFIITLYLSSRTSDRQPYITLDCDHGDANKPRTKSRVDDEEEECCCPFKLKGNLMAMSENCQLFIHDGRHNHALDVYNHVPRKYKILLPRLRGIGCRGETWYNMPLLEVVGMTTTGKNFTVATAFIRNEQATTYRWVLQ
ncbi:hypothetical protein M9H77_18366 [Catharanthus roseus]|uniref:Uncharacterized protein n=1 Tax=Catharanthus roseus TaxID=4058 RepID=A0ACC0B7J8_CATRO|nr:hypothetical protein M9H77_18366 [Catharanthus roseus]